MFHEFWFLLHFSSPSDGGWLCAAAGGGGREWTTWVIWKGAEDWLLITSLLCWISGDSAKPPPARGAVGTNQAFSYLGSLWIMKLKQPTALSLLWKIGNSSSLVRRVSCSRRRRRWPAPLWACRWWTPMTHQPFTPGPSSSVRRMEPGLASSWEISMLQTRTGSPAR